MGLSGTTRFPACLRRKCDYHPVKLAAPQDTPLNQEAQLNRSIVEEIVRWRMGSAYDAPILDWRDSRLNFDNPIALDNALAGAIKVEDSGPFVCPPPGRGSYGPARHPRLVEAAEDIYRAWNKQGGTLSAFLAMNDARLFPSVEYIGLPTEAKCMQLSYARTVSPHWRSSTEIALWPLPVQYRGWKLPSFTPVKWDERKPELLWRGQASGLSYTLADEARPIFMGIRQMRRWLEGWLREEAASDESSFENWACSYQRLIAVMTCQNIPGADARLIPLWNGDKRAIEVAEKYLGEGIATERIDVLSYLTLQQKYNYALSLPGNDVPSSLRHDLLSGCLVLMPRPFWESSWFFGLKPDIHYIPLRADLADLEERLQWCRDNDGHCKEVAQSARVFAMEHFDPALEQEVQSRFAERLAQMTITMTGS